MYRSFEKKHSVNAVTFNRQYPDFLFPGETQYVTENDPSDKIPSERLLDTINPFSYLRTARSIRKNAPDILVMKYWMTFFGPALGAVSKRMLPTTKRICVLDNLIPHEKRFFDGFCNRYFLRHTDGYVVMSNSVLNDLLAMKPDAKYLRIDHPLYDHFGAKLNRMDACTQLGLPTDRKFALFFGFIRDYKGLDLLIEAFKSVDDTIDLIIAGEVYGSFENYQEMIDNSGVKNRIHVFNQYIGDADVPAFFSVADVCVLPYKSATQSGITSISYHFNVPIIATDVGGLKETIEDGKTGIIVKTPAPGPIAEGINTFFKAQKALEFDPHIEAYKKNHSWDNFTTQLLDFAEKLNR
jgi:glycosyltransferase involved in cell wall biosynthesis